MPSHAPGQRAKQRIQLVGAPLLSQRLLVPTHRTEVIGVSVVSLRIVGIEVDGQSGLLFGSGEVVVVAKCNIGQNVVRFRKSGVQRERSASQSLCFGHYIARPLPLKHTYEVTLRQSRIGL